MESATRRHPVTIWILGKGREMEKYMCYGALGVAGLFFLLSLIDLILGFPFGGGAFIVGDIFMMIVALMVGYLGYNALRDLK
jgi:hypothetical protein